MTVTLSLCQLYLTQYEDFLDTSRVQSSQSYCGKIHFFKLSVTFALLRDEGTTHIENYSGLGHTRK